MTTPALLVELTFDFPPAALSPNARGRWSRIDAVTHYRRDCKNIAVDSRTKLGFAYPLRPPVQAILTFVLTNNRRLDGDNLVSRCKPLFDGLVDAKVLQDDSIQAFHWTWDWEIGPRRVVKVSLMEAAA